MSNKIINKEVVNKIKNVVSSLSGPIGFGCDCYNLYYTFSMFKEGKIIELGLENVGNSVGKRIGNVIGGFIGTMLLPGGGSVAGFQIGGMVGSFLGGKGFKSKGEKINNY